MRNESPKTRARWSAAVATAMMLGGTAARADSLTVTDDASINFNSIATNYGSAATLTVTAGAKPYDSLVGFDLAPLPGNASLSKVTLRLFVHSVTAAGTVTVKRVTSAWAEGTVKASAPPTLDAAALGTIALTTASASHFVDVDVTGVVNNWLSGAQSNYGIELIPDATVNATFESKEGAHASGLEAVPLGLAGPQGPAGATGPQGSAGPMGPAGATGSQGAAGAQGIQGPVGTTGAQGIQGPAGTTGAQGPKGDTGAQGVSGGQGPKGDTGAQGIPGPPGQPGTAGAPGAAGTGIRWRGAWDGMTNYSGNDIVSLNGASYIALSANMLAQPDTFPQDWNLVAQAGATGLQGPPGAPGQQGAQGPMGPAGASVQIATVDPGSYDCQYGGVVFWNDQSGAVACNGAPGRDGSQGPAGAPGVAGPPGPAGPAGAVFNPMQLALHRYYPAMVGAAFPVGAAPSGMAFDGQNIWVANSGAGTLSKVHAGDGTVETFQIGCPGAHAPVFDGSNVWLLCTDGTLPQIRARDAHPLHWWVHNKPGLVTAFDGANVWVGDSDGTLTAIRASSGQAVASTVIGQSVSALAFDGTNMWVGHSPDSEVVVVHLGNGTIDSVTSMATPAPVQSLVFDGTGMWAATGAGVTRLLPNQGAVATYTVSASRVEFDGQNLWVSSAIGGPSYVSKLRASDGATLGTFAAGSSPRDLAFDGASVWVANFSDNTLSRL